MQDHRHTHWNYFLALEERLSEVSRFIELAESNFKTYSIELAHLLLATSSEVDVVLKRLCIALDPDHKLNNISGYNFVIDKSLPEIKTRRILCNRYHLEFSPLAKWTEKKSPKWWKDNNKVKHHRGSYFHKANLENTINALTALFIINIYMHCYEEYNRRKENKNTAYPPDLRTSVVELKPESHLFQFDDPFLYLRE